MDHEDGIMETFRRYELAQVERGRSIMAGSFDFGPYRIPSVATEISDIDNGEKARKCIDDMSVLEALLKQAGEYGQYAAQYLVLECQMWMRISAAMKEPASNEVKESFYIKLTKKEHNMLSWIGGKTEDQQMVVIAECSRGRSVWAQKKDEATVKNTMQVERCYENAASTIITSLSENGRTTCSVDSFYKNWRGSRKPNYPTVKAFVEKTRDLLLKSGAVGIGDGKGTYVLPDHLAGSEVGDAVNARVSSLLADIQALQELCHKCQLHLPKSAAKLIRARLIDAANALEKAS